MLVHLELVAVVELVIPHQLVHLKVILVEMELDHLDMELVAVVELELQVVMVQVHLLQVVLVVQGHLLQ